MKYQFPLVIGGKHSAISIPLSAFRYQHSAISIPLSAFRYQHSVISIPLSAFRYQHSVISIPLSAFSQGLVSTLLDVILNKRGKLRPKAALRERKV
ncbi:hypothetical protein [Moorena sp. SIO4E2]|uniref:hypothetical protein n=1 Tax=Moorena sp. SIO4E2 TaxID=2607826 RepID=UPI00257CB3A0|nr:hypothetical protein [Moorena sp. SIO4E2]